MTERSIDELGPVDYLIVEFPAGHQNFTGESVAELVKLHDAGPSASWTWSSSSRTRTVPSRPRSSNLAELGELERIEEQLVETLAADDVATLAEAMAPGSVAGVLVFENLWAAPFASSVRRAGGQLIADGRIPIQAIIAAVEADAAAEAEGA